MSYKECIDSWQWNYISCEYSDIFYEDQLVYCTIVSFCHVLESHLIKGKNKNDVLSKNW